jgi:hypothetical protein
MTPRPRCSKGAWPKSQSIKLDCAIRQLEAAHLVCDIPFELDHKFWRRGRYWTIYIHRYEKRVRVIIDSGRFSVVIRNHWTTVLSSDGRVGVQPAPGAHLAADTLHLVCGDQGLGFKP